MAPHGLDRLGAQMAHKAHTSKEVCACSFAEHFGTEANIVPFCALCSPEALDRENAIRGDQVGAVLT